MDDTRAWVICIVVTLLIIGLVAFARGPDHRRGDEIGALRSPVLTTAN
ncbi:MAG: hypothetical protein ACRDKF_13005 [Actinomycetota bacterium]